jgi:hypothetical protein
MQIAPENLFASFLSSSCPLFVNQQGLEAASQLVHKSLAKLGKVCVQE